MRLRKMKEYDCKTIEVEEKYRGDLTKIVEIARPSIVEGLKDVGEVNDFFQPIGEDKLKKVSVKARVLYHGKDYGDVNIVIKQIGFGKGKIFYSVTAEDKNDE